MVPALPAANSAVPTLFRIYLTVAILARMILPAISGHRYDCGPCLGSLFSVLNTLIVWFTTPEQGPHARYSFF